MNENDARELKLGDCLVYSWDNSECQVSGFIGSKHHPVGIKLYWKDSGKFTYVDFRGMSKFSFLSHIE